MTWQGKLLGLWLGERSGLWVLQAHIRWQDDVLPLRLFLFNPCSDDWKMGRWHCVWMPSSAREPLLAANGERSRVRSLESLGLATHTGWLRGVAPIEVPAARTYLGRGWHIGSSWRFGLHLFVLPGAERSDRVQEEGSSWYWSVFTHLQRVGTGRRCELRLLQARR